MTLIVKFNDQAYFTATPSGPNVPEGVLAIDALTSAAQVELYNSIIEDTGGQVVNKFTDRKTGHRRIVKALVELEAINREDAAAAPEDAPKTVPASEVPAKKAVPAPKVAQDAPAGSKMNRETWLELAASALTAAFFTENGYEVPRIQVACGFPRASSKAIGQCWDPKSSTDETVQIFVCPTQSEPVRVLDILLHELIHASVGLDQKHGGVFRKLALEFGLAGKMTATFAEEGTDLYVKLGKIATKIGDYPHAAMIKKGGTKKENPNRRIRLESKTETTYTVSISPKAIEAFGMPVDPWGDEMQRRQKDL